MVGGPLRPFLKCAISCILDDCGSQRSDIFCQILFSIFVTPQRVTNLRIDFRKSGKQIHLWRDRHKDANHSYPTISSFQLIGASATGGARTNGTTQLFVLRPIPSLQSKAALARLSGEKQSRVHVHLVVHAPALLAGLTTRLSH